MKSKRAIYLLFSVLLLACLFISPFTVFASPLSHQPSSITGSGSISHDQSACGTFDLVFNPAGGPVSGSVHLICRGFDPNSGTKSVEETLDCNFTGSFAGGDGGLVSGTLSSGTYTVTYFVECPECVNKTENTAGVPWEGHLRADGTGNGWVGLEDVVWNISYSAADFSAGLVAPTLAQVPTLSGLATQPSVPTDQSPAQSAPDVSSLWPADSVSHMQSLSDLDTAVTEILNQDDAIIALDDQGVFYAVDNQGIKKELPVDLQDQLKMNNEFGLLLNANILWASSAVQAFVADHGQNSLDAISGTGTFQYYTIPQWLKTRRYLKEAMTCSGGYCGPIMTISIVPSSEYFPPQKFASSEHSSVRGTINGGGDFIYEPSPSTPLKLASLVFVPGILPQTPPAIPFLGVKVVDMPAYAFIQQVQRGSPAEAAGLVVNEQIISVDGTPVDLTNKLSVLLAKVQGGSQVTLGVLYGNQSLSVPVTLGTLSPRIIDTPSAQIFLLDTTEMLLDIGPTGVTAVLVLNGVAHVKEMITGSELDVQAGNAVIVVPGYEIGNPIPVKSTDITAWWVNGTSAASPPSGSSSESEPLSAATKLVLWIGASCIILLLVGVVVLIVVLTRRKKKPAPPPIIPPPPPQ